MPGSALPAIFSYASWLLRSAEEPAAFSLHLSVTFDRFARLFVVFSGARWLIHFNGLARRHFRWPEPVRVMLRREFRWLTVVALVCVPLTIAMAQKTPCGPISEDTASQ